ncbi:MAG: hypothetical protein ABF291_03225, partial [Desulfobacterales bacterium]
VATGQSFDVGLTVVSNRQGVVQQQLGHIHRILLQSIVISLVPLRHDSCKVNHGSVCPLFDRVACRRSWLGNTLVICRNQEPK